jgi:4-amino-4-deoxychorismate lyase
MPDMLINGEPGESIIAQDRGLQYGDGVFRTLLLRGGKLQHWQRHYQKLHHDCAGLGIECPSMSLLDADLAKLTAVTAEGVIKIIITRGISSRGYAPQPESTSSRLVSLSPMPVYADSLAEQGIQVQFCNLRLGHQPRLAGIKHLNRLENVLAAGELKDTGMMEGILLDEDDCVIEGTRSNLFMVQDGKLYTPDLSRCGVAGVQRDRVIELAASHGITCEVRPVKMQELLAADEIFLVNSVIGLWPVRELAGYKRQHFPVSRQIQAWLND